MNVLVWLRRDLRVTDQPALTLAAGRGRVLPVFIAQPSEWRQADRSARHWGFVAECLADLRADLAALGLPLVVRLGEAQPVLERLVRAHAVTEIVCQAEGGAGWAASRDRQIAAWAAGCGLRWTCLPAQALPPSAASALIEAPQPRVLRPVAGVEPGSLPAARALGLPGDPCPHRQPGGRRAAELLLEGLARQRLALPLPAGAPLAVTDRAAARLSPHLAWGSLGPADLARLAPPEGLAPPARAAWQAGFRRLETGLHARAIAQDGPARLPPAAEDGADAPALRLAALAVGETGLPFLDACLRSLRATGWLDARGRGWVFQAATRILGLEARAVGLVLARLCTDHDPAILWHEVARLRARPGAFPDPTAEGLRRDPGGAFTRRWLPELAALPDADLHQPWRWPGAARLLGRRYPEPLVDPATARRQERPPPAPGLRRAPPRPIPGQLCLDL